MKNLADSPSNAHRSVGCPSWARLARDLKIKPPKFSSKYTMEGRVVHDLVHRYYCDKRHPSKFVGMYATETKRDIFYNEVAGYRVTAEMAGNAVGFIEQVKDLEKSLVNPRIASEYKVDLGRIGIPGRSGYIDLALVEAIGSLWVLDYKDGFVDVPVDDNPGTMPQLALYAAALIGSDNPDLISRVHVGVYQPNSLGPNFKTGSYSVECLFRWLVNTYWPAREQEGTGDDPYVLKTGDWCKYCPVDGAVLPDGNLACPAQRQQIDDALDNVEGKTTFDRLVAAKPDPTAMTQSQLDLALSALGPIKKWMNAVESEAYERLKMGADNAPTVMKLVQGSLPNRSWADEKEVKAEYAGRYGDKIYAPRKLKSPAQLEKILKNEKLNETLLNPRLPGPPRMAPVSSSLPSAGLEFEDLFKDA
jgi:hypothetical protein